MGVLICLLYKPLYFPTCCVALYITLDFFFSFQKKARNNWFPGTGATPISIPDGLKVAEIYNEEQNLRTLSSWKATRGMENQFKTCRLNYVLQQKWDAQQSSLSNEGNSGLGRTTIERTQLCDCCVRTEATKWGRQPIIIGCLEVDVAKIAVMAVLSEEVAKYVLEPGILRWSPLNLPANWKRQPQMILAIRRLFYHYSLWIDFAYENPFWNERKYSQAQWFRIFLTIWYPVRHLVVLQDWTTEIVTGMSVSLKVTDPQINFGCFPWAALTANSWFCCQPCACKDQPGCGFL